jgi:tetratricopeptide (TPR) repeat protein
LNHAPEDALVYNDRGWAKFQKQDFPAAVDDATHSIQINSTNGYAYGTRGWARYGSGNVVGAVEDCKKAIELSKPDSSETAYDQGLLDFVNGDYEKAVASWQKVIAQDPTLKLGLQSWIEKAQAKLQNKIP